MFKGNMKKIMKQAKEMQSQMMETQKELESMEVEGAAGGGAVKAVLNGKKELISPVFTFLVSQSVLIFPKRINIL